MKRSMDMKRTLCMIMAVMMAACMMAQGRPHDGHRHGDGHGGHGNGHGRHIECATHEQLGMTMQVLEQQSFDDKKLEIARLCVTLGHFCVDDLARIATVFSFDDNRLQFLTYAYDYCQDPQNYYALRDAFSFRSNFDTMMETLHPGSHRY